MAMVEVMRYTGFKEMVYCCVDALGDWIGGDGE